MNIPRCFEPDNAGNFLVAHSLSICICLHADSSLYEQKNPTRPRHTEFDLTTELEIDDSTDSEWQLTFF